MRAADSELPEFYGKTGIVLLPVDPRLTYVYWEVAQKDLRRAQRNLARKFADARAVLRFHDLGCMAKNEKHQENFFDVEVELASGSMFVPLWSSGRTYQVELGLKGPGDRFFSLTCSNMAGTATDSADGRADARFVMVTGERQIIEIPGGTGAGQPGEGDRTGCETISDSGQPSKAERRLSTMAGFPQKESFRELKVQNETAVNPGAPAARIAAATADEVVKTGASAEGNSESRQPFDSQHALKRRLSELSAFRKGPLLQVKKGSESIQTDQAAHPKADRKFSSDVTAWCEKQFHSGVSSRKASRRKE